MQPEERWAGAVPPRRSRRPTDCTETLVALLKRRPLRAAPEFTQYDPYLGIFRHGRLRWGNRGPLQRLKLRFIASKFADKIETFNHTGFQPMPGTAPDA